MLPTLIRGDRVMVSPLAFGPRSEAFGFRIPGLGKPKHGDIVLVDAPFRKKAPWYVHVADSFVRFFTLQHVSIVEWQNGIRSRTLKRVIGIPGDTVYQKDFSYYVKTRDDQHFLTEFERSGHIYDIRKLGLPEFWPPDFPLSGFHGEVTLGDGEYFVIGDNRSLATDSRLFGKIHENDITGKLVLRYWPLSQWGIPP